jgi:hypothetical protein
VQVAAAHCVPAAYFWQAPDPSQNPLLPQVGAVASVHWFKGSCPAGTLVQAPWLPVRPQDWQVPAQAELQQNPCAQNPELQLVPAVHAAPIGNLPQLDAVQTLGDPQSLLLPQVMRHVPLAPQLNGEQLEVPPGAQVPLPSQRPDCVSVEPLQVCAVQTVPLG